MQYDDSLKYYFKRLSHLKPLKTEEEIRLSRLIKKGNRKALVKLVESNLKFVVQVATQYAHQGVALQDLIAIGNVGLIKAAHRFDGSKNFKFISYAVWWIRQAILQGLADQSRMARLPINKVADVYALGKATNRLEGHLHHRPTVEELAVELKVDPEAITFLMGIASPKISLNSPVEEDGALCRIDLLPGGMRSDDTVEERTLREDVMKILNTLEKRERRVLMMYFGFETGTPMNLEEIGDAVGVTRERVRQIRNRALERLRATVPRYKTMMDFIAD